MIQHPGAYLEVLDAYLLASHFGKDLLIAVDNVGSGEPFQLSRMEHFLDPGQPTDLDPQSRWQVKENSWILISCNAVYDPTAVKNHWVPGFHKDHIPAESWEDLAVDGSYELEQEIVKARREFKRADALAESDEDRALVQSKEMEWQEFFVTY